MGNEVLELGALRGKGGSKGDSLWPGRSGFHGSQRLPPTPAEGGSGQAVGLGARGETSPLYIE
jgi:hypothetical protein